MALGGKQTGVLGGELPAQPSSATSEPLRAEELRDAIGDILDICEGWTRTMTDKQALAAIKDVAHKAWEGERG